MGFQSSPSLSEGRYFPHLKFAPTVNCFNPRPPFRKGATVDTVASSNQTYVSILALPFGRALHDVVAPVVVAVDVSILALPFGRALPGRTLSKACGLLFQSSPSLSEGRYYVGKTTEVIGGVFQSSPSLSEGRYLGPPARLRTGHSFQSSPSLSEGRYD
mgnify:CR=1 FL=1